MFFLFKQKTAYEMRISDWSSDVCSSDLSSQHRALLGDANRVCFPFQGDPRTGFERMLELAFRWVEKRGNRRIAVFGRRENKERLDDMLMKMGLDAATRLVLLPDLEARDLAALYCRRSAEHTHELQYIMRHSHAYCCFKNK